MGKTIKHLNILQPNPGLGKEEYNYIEFVCRGAKMNRYREMLLNNYLASTQDRNNRINDNSLLTLEEEPDNRYDPNAIIVVCRGEFYGTLGYVGREYTEQIKDALYRCDSYRIDMVRRVVPNDGNIKMVMTWQE